jgi:hypothetical protein
VKWELKWPWTRGAGTKDRATRSQRLWFTAVTKDPFGQKARAEARRKLFREHEHTFATLDALDESDCF